MHIVIPICIRRSPYAYMEGPFSNPHMHTGIEITPHMHMGINLNPHMHTGMSVMRSQYASQHQIFSNYWIIPTCFSKDECDGLWKLYFWRQPENLSLLLSQLFCFLSTHVSFWRFFYTDLGPQKPFFSQALHSNHLKTISENWSSHPIPPTYNFSLNQHKTYHHGGSTPSRQALHPEQDVPICLGYAAHQDKESTPINSDHATSPMQPWHTPIPN